VPLAVAVEQQRKEREEAEEIAAGIRLWLSDQIVVG